MERDQRIEWPPPRDDPDREPVEPWARRYREAEERDGWPGWLELRKHRFFVWR